MNVTNNSAALQGVHTETGVVYIRPGQTLDVKLSKEGEKLARRLKFLSFGGGDTKDDDKPTERDELKKQADELGLQYAGNISNAKLKELIDAKLAE